MRTFDGYSRILQFECDLVSNFGPNQDRIHYVVNEHDIITEKIGNVTIFVIPILYYWESSVAVTQLSNVGKFLRHSEQTIEYYYIKNPRMISQGDSIRIHEFHSNKNNPPVFCLDIK